MPAPTWCCAALLSLLAAPVSAQVPNGLLGRWVIDHVVGAPADDTLPGLVPYMAFREAGVLEVGFTVGDESRADSSGRTYSQDGTYRVEASTLILDIFGELVEQPFRLDGDALVMDDPHLGVTTHLRRAHGPEPTRVRAPAPTPQDGNVPEGLTGRWTVERVAEAAGRPDPDAEEIVALAFHEDGTVEFEFTTVDPESQDPVPFRIADGRLFLDLDGEVEYGEIHFDGDAMTLRDRATGSALHLRRDAE